MNHPAGIRPPAVAGLFYPADPTRLREDVAGMLGDAPAPRRPHVRAVLAPHAGLVYSGALAATAIRATSISGAPTVVVIAPSHVEAFDFTSVFSGSAYRTPLGDVQVDTELAGALAGGPGIRLSDRGHAHTPDGRGEHAVEVELPFIQVLCEGARVVPIVMGSQSWDACRALGQSLATCLPDDAVVVASSDLSHFHASDVADGLDTRFAEVLVSEDARRLHDAVRTGQCEACGAGPVVATLLAMQHAGDGSCELLDRANSGDVNGDRSSVVGYAAAIIGARSTGASL